MLSLPLQFLPLLLGEEHGQHYPVIVVGYPNLLQRVLSGYLRPVDVVLYLQAIYLLQGLLDTSVFYQL